MFRFSLVITASIISALFCTKVHADTITIDLESHQLIYTDGTAGVYLSFPIVGPTPSAKNVYNNVREFDIDRIDLNPNWISSSGVKFPAGHIRNPLGVGRIRFADTFEGFSRPCSIHGGAKRRDLGQSLSGCCIRLLDEHFMELFFHVTTNTQVLFDTADSRGYEQRDMDYFYELSK